MNCLNPVVILEKLPGDVWSEGPKQTTRCSNISSKRRHTKDCLPVAMQTASAMYHCPVCDALFPTITRVECHFLSTHTGETTPGNRGNPNTGSSDDVEITSSSRENPSTEAMTDCWRAPRMETTARWESQERSSRYSRSERGDKLTQARAKRHKTGPAKISAAIGKQPPEVQRRIAEGFLGRGRCEAQVCHGSLGSREAGTSVMNNLVSLHDQAKSCSEGQISRSMDVLIPKSYTKVCQAKKRKRAAKGVDKMSGGANSSQRAEPQTAEFDKSRGTSEGQSEWSPTQKRSRYTKIISRILSSQTCGGLTHIVDADSGTRSEDSLDRSTGEDSLVMVQPEPAPLMATPPNDPATFTCSLSEDNFAKVYSITDYHQLSREQSTKRLCQDFRNRPVPGFDHMKLSAGKPTMGYRLRCTWCPEEFATSDGVTTHFRRVHGSQEMQHKCPDCHLGFFSGNVLKKHMLHFHTPTSEQKGPITAVTEPLSTGASPDLAEASYPGSIPTSTTKSSVEHGLAQVEAKSSSSFTDDESEVGSSCAKELMFGTSYDVQKEGEMSPIVPHNFHGLPEEDCTCSEGPNPDTSVDDLPCFCTPPYTSTPHSEIKIKEAKCHACCRVFSSVIDLIGHMESTHKSMVISIACPRESCKFSSRSMNCLLHHVQNGHQDVFREQAIKAKVTCKIFCSKDSAGSRKQTVRVSISNPNPRGVGIDTDKDEENHLESSAMEELQFECPFYSCKKHFLSLSIDEVLSHVRTHWGDLTAEQRNNFSVPLGIPYQVVSPGEVGQRHTKYACPDCGLAFRGSDAKQEFYTHQLQDHRLMALTYKCPLATCRYLSIVREDMLQHLHFHVVHCSLGGHQKQFQVVDIVRRTLPMSPLDVLEHMVLMYRCPLAFCMYSATEISQMREHVKTHEGVFSAQEILHYQTANLPEVIVPCRDASTLASVSEAREKCVCPFPWCLFSCSALNAMLVHLALYHTEKG